MATEASVTIENGVSFGASVNYDIVKKNIAKYTTGVLYKQDNFSFLMRSQGANELGLTFFQKMDKLELGYKVDWNRRKIAGSYGGAFLKAKLDNFGKLGLVYSTPLESSGSQNVHKFGLSLSFSE